MIGGSGGLYIAAYNGVDAYALSFPIFKFCLHSCSFLEPLSGSLLSIHPTFCFIRERYVLDFQCHSRCYDLNSRDK